jgi:hypothetical protein
MSAGVSSKIPVAKHRRPSPERPSPAASPQKSASKLPVKVCKSDATRQYKENVYDASPVMMSPSRIPVMRHDADDAVIAAASGRKHSTSSSLSSQPRPQSIDLEDEYFSSKSYIMSPSPDKNQVER